MRKIILHRNAPGERPGYWAECPSLGLIKSARTVEEVVTLIKETIELHIEDLIAFGDPVPPEDVIVDDVDELELIVG